MLCIVAIHSIPSPCLPASLWKAARLMSVTHVASFSQCGRLEPVRVASAILGTTSLLRTEKSFTVWKLSAHSSQAHIELGFRAETVKWAPGMMTPRETDIKAQKKQTATGEWSAVVFSQSSDMASTQKCPPDQGKV